jgi:hypothetical protein
MPDVTPEQARDFYRAAASFYRKAPWRSAGEGETIKVECEPLDGGPWYALVLGMGGTVKGLILCDDWKSRALLDRGPYDAIADQLQHVTVHFGDCKDIHLDDLALVDQLGFEVAGPNAYPSVFRTERGRHHRQPDSRELELLEACLWVIPDFVERAKDRKPEEFEYAFKGTSGKLTLDLSWVPMRRLKAGRPEEAP